MTHYPNHGPYESYNCYDTYRSLEILVWFFESGQVFLRTFFIPLIHFSKKNHGENGGQHKKKHKRKAIAKSFPINK